MATDTIELVGFAILVLGILALMASFGWLGEHTARALWLILVGFIIIAGANRRPV